jgi:AAA family ATPase
MDGIQELFGVIVVAATNRPDVMVSFTTLSSTKTLNSSLQDSALMRPGRLDRILYIGPPDRHGREEIIRIRTAKMRVKPGVDFAELAEMVRGGSLSSVNADLVLHYRLKAALERRLQQCVKMQHSLLCAKIYMRQILVGVIS